MSTTKRDLYEMMTLVGDGACEPVDRLALADLLDEAGRDAEALAVRSGVRLGREWVHQDYLDWHHGRVELSEARLCELRAVPMADHFRIVARPEPAAESSACDLFADV
jgi:hypothetical protein